MLLTLKGLVLAGTGSGLTEGVFITPFEKVKVSLQAKRSHASIVSFLVVGISTMTLIPEFFVKSPSTWSHARSIIKTNGLGLNGLFGGLGATLWRHGVWNAVYFGFYHNLRPIVLEKEVAGI